MMNISNIHLTTRMKQIIFLLLIALVFTILPFDSAFALCDANVSYENALKESELVFKGTVTRLDNSGDSKEITFPDQAGEIISMGSSSSCAADVPMKEFVFDIQRERGTIYGHIEMKFLESITLL